ncbi:MAG: type I-C CRISPR-associated protein Cas5 [Candidatus Riflebacteria bacterium]|nr:type I-C CRISPR-associated protein Cas5 [Candidatus Riflebacteria bacterium]
MKNSINFKLWGQYALFTDPITKIGGEKCSYLVPTYEAIKGVLKSIYWKPTIIWRINKIRVVKPIRTQTKGVKPLSWNGGNSLAFYTFLHEVEYQIEAHFVWNEFRPELKPDRIDGKHYSIAKRVLEKGGRQDIFLGTRDCQGYVEPCQFGEGTGAYDNIDEMAFGLMFHSFGYPDEIGGNELKANFWLAKMKYGIIEYPNMELESLNSRSVRPMIPKVFDINKNQKSVEVEEQNL